MSIKNKLWNTNIINETIEKIEMGIEDVDTSCFYNNDINYRNANINFEMSTDELTEYIKCSNDVLYFANNYCYAMTDDGIQKIKLREYQERILKDFQKHRFNILLASRQIGKSTTASIFLTWYLCFNFDKNVLIVAHKQSGAEEIVLKIKTIIANLPFFLKPGIINSGVYGLRFDNGCRLISQATTKTSAIGYTVHLLYADEFAHIHPNFIVPFYRSIYPTISSSKISRIIITSTANGINLFYKIYNDAVQGKNTYNPIRVDWWEVPGRDEKWKDQEIQNLGSEELFNQEYGNQFISSSKSIIDSESLKYFKRISKEYVFKELYKSDLDPNDYKHLLWHPNFEPNQSFRENDIFLISVDLSDNIGKDYTIFNIFKLELNSVSKIRKFNKLISDESDLFRLIQVGLFRSNTTPLDQCALILNDLILKIFKPESVSVILEMNFKGDYFLELLRKNKKMEEVLEEIFIHTKHTSESKNKKIGLKLNKENKLLLSKDLNNYIKNKRIIITELKTLEELKSFSQDDSGKISGQGINDDIAMSCLNSVIYFKCDDFYDKIDYFIDDINILLSKAKFNLQNDDDIELKSELEFLRNINIRLND